MSLQLSTVKALGTTQVPGDRGQLGCANPMPLTSFEGCQFFLTMDTYTRSSGVDELGWAGE